MPGQIVRITLPAPPTGVSYFHLQFRLPGASLWVPYSRASATPGAPEDLPAGLLVSGVYVLDGLNGPSGNMEAASAARTLYQAAWKGDYGVTNWGRTFRQKRVG